MASVDVGLDVRADTVVLFVDVEVSSVITVGVSLVVDIVIVVSPVVRTAFVIAEGVTVGSPVASVVGTMFVLSEIGT